MDAALPPRRHLLTAFILVPLAVVFAAAWHYGLWADVKPGFRAMVLVVVVVFGALAAGAWLGMRDQKGWSHWLPVLAWAVPLAGAVLFAGKAMASAALLGAAALAVGTWFRPPASSGITLPLLAGMACLAGIVGWLLPFPVHHRASYLAVATLLIAMRWRPLLGLLRDAAREARILADTHPSWSILLAASASIASLGLWLPSLNYDDNAVHLILPSQLLFDGYYRLDVQTQSWAVAPWANNVLHAITTLFAGEDVRPAVASVWLLLGMAGAWRLARALDASAATALAAAAVFAAQPLAGYFTTTMQVDGANAAIFLHLAAIAATPPARRPGPLLIGLIGGLLLALKTSNLIYLGPLVVWLCLSQPRGTRLRWFGLFALGLLPVGASNYVYAWLVTGNPLFPFYNAVFRSAYYPLENFRDLKWMAGVGWRSLWDLTFRTQLYGQFYPGAAGLAVLATLPALLVDGVRRPAPRWIALWALVTGLVLFWFMQYLRYIFPALAVLAVLGTVALARLVGQQIFAAAIVALVLADAMLMPTTSWIARENHWAQLLREGPSARVDIERRVMPERVLLARLMARDPDACVLMSDPKAPFVGAGNGRGISMHRRYDPELWRARNEAEADLGGGKWRALLARIGASHVIVDPGKEPRLARASTEMGHVILDREGALELRGVLHGQAATCQPGLRRSRNMSSTLSTMLGTMLGTTR